MSAKQEQKAEHRLERRSFLKGLGLAAGGTAGAAVAVAAADEEGETPEEQAKSRYRETEHVKRFYELNRL